jgi:hypothetical protein
MTGVYEWMACDRDVIRRYKSECRCMNGKYWVGSSDGGGVESVVRVLGRGCSGRRTGMV